MAHKVRAISFALLMKYLKKQEQNDDRKGIYVLELRSDQSGALVDILTKTSLVVWSDLEELKNLIQECFNEESKEHSRNRRSFSVNNVDRIGTYLLKDIRAGRRQR